MHFKLDCLSNEIKKKKTQQIKVLNLHSFQARNEVLCTKPGTLNMHNEDMGAYWEEHVGKQLEKDEII